MNKCPWWTVSVGMVNSCADDMILQRESDVAHRGYYSIQLKTRGVCVRIMIASKYRGYGFTRSWYSVLRSYKSCLGCYKALIGQTKPSAVWARTCQIFLGYFYSPVGISMFSTGNCFSAKQITSKNFLRLYIYELLSHY